MSGELLLRPARPDEAPRVHDLHDASVRALCAGHYAAHVIDGWLLNRAPEGYLSPLERGDLFVAERDGRVIGFGEATAGRVVAVFVDPAAVRRGGGRAILRHAVALARRGHPGPVRLHATLNARDFYAREGFRDVEGITVRRNAADIRVVVMEYEGR